MYLPNTYKSHKLNAKGATITLSQDEKLDRMDKEKLEALITLFGGFNPLFNANYTLTPEDTLKLEELQYELDILAHETAMLLYNLKPRS